MGKPVDQLPPSEALPGIGEHCLVFHNGRGFYYFCKEFSSFLDKRLFQCVRRECEVTATMGEGSGSPLIDSGVHCHEPDFTYREKCLLVHNIRQQFQAQDIPAALVLREALSFIEENEESRTSSPQNFECVTLPTEEAFVELKQEQADTDIEIEEQDAKEIIFKSVGETMTVDQLLGAMQNSNEEQFHLADSQPTTSKTLQSLLQKDKEYDDYEDYNDDIDDGDDEDYSLTDGSNKRKPKLKLLKQNAKKQDNAQSKKFSDLNANVDEQILEAILLLKKSVEGRSSLKTLMRLEGKHFLMTIPATKKKEFPTKRCVVCFKHGLRREVRVQCKKCLVALHVDTCFELYHTSVNY